jgi:ABC-2 type transport system ATP-binding protein
MADRIGVINKGELVVVEEKQRLMRKLGKKRLTIHLVEPLAAIPASLARWALVPGAQGRDLAYTFDAHEEATGIPELLEALRAEGLAYRDLDSRASSLEEIFVGLVSERAKGAA